MSDESVVTEFKRLLGEVRDLATEAERERCWQAVAGVLNKAWKSDESSRPAWADLVNCRDVLLPPDSQPPAPPPEPMTVEKLTAQIRGGPMEWRHGPDSEMDVIRLVKEQVQAQARLDAEVCFNLEGERMAKGLHGNCCTGCVKTCGTAILKSAGLK